MRFTDKMKRTLIIAFLFVVVGLMADDYVDDVYYSPVEAGLSLPAHYDKAHMKPLVFVEDTLQAPEPMVMDTLAAVAQP